MKRFKKTRDLIKEAVKRTLHRSEASKAYWDGLLSRNPKPTDISQS